MLARAREGDRSALAYLAAQYEPEVRLVARLRLGQGLRPYLDSMDLVQSVHRSLLVGLRQNKFDVSTPEKLIALALTIVRRKAARHWRREQRQQRLSGGVTGGDALVQMIAGLASPQPTPADTVAFRDTVASVCRHLSDLEKQMLELQLQGYRTVEIAERLGQDPDVLRVRLSRLRQRLRAGGVLGDEF
jgi:RNA polymerase sigma-70 factor (ECF subfamily)